MSCALGKPEISGHLAKAMDVQEDATNGIELIKWILFVVLFLGLFSLC